MEILPHFPPVERVIKLPPDAAREDGKLGQAREAPQACMRKQPFLRGHVSFAVLAPIKLHELSLYCCVVEIRAKRPHPGVRKFPVVIEARTILPPVEFRARHPLSGEETDGFKRGALEGSTRVHQHTIDIENNYRGAEAHWSSFWRSSQSQPE